jgi:hypothetical protein
MALPQPAASQQGPPQAKTARALHRTAPDTTADNGSAAFNQSIKRQMVPNFTWRFRAEAVPDDIGGMVSPGGRR